MPTILNVDPLDIDFSHPKSVTGKGFTCHYQYASLHNEFLYVQTPTFTSNGPSKSRFNDHLQLLLPKSSTSTLHKIDERAKQCLEVPSDASNQLRKSIEGKDAYKELPSEGLYLKFSKDLKCFNEKGSLIHRDLTAGKYTLVLHVIGIFIGNHGSSPSVASLQVRIKQVRFEPHSESLFIQPTLLNRRGVTLSKLDIGVNCEEEPMEKEVTEENESDSSDTSYDEDDEDLLVRSKKARKLLNEFRMNNYPTQQATGEEQLEHDKYLESLDSQLCDLLGQDWQAKYLY